MQLRQFCKKWGIAHHKLHRYLRVPRGTIAKRLLGEDRASYVPATPIEEWVADLLDEQFTRASQGQKVTPEIRKLYNSRS